jgi:predicted hydrocarbon binding protein
MTDSSATQMVGVGIPTLRELRSAVLATADSAAAVIALREAGYAGGDAVLAAFEQWLAEHEAGSATEHGAQRMDAGELTLDGFGERARSFFRNAGWGEVSFTPDDAEGLAIVDIENCWEAGASGSAPDSKGPGCHITTGLLAAFFGRLAGYPVAVLETECSDDGGSRCRFLLGNPDIMNYTWQEMR